MATPLAAADVADIKRLRDLTREEVLCKAFDWLAGRNERRQKLAAAVLATMGQSVMPQLIYILERCDPELQLRILGIIGEIGGELTPELAMAFCTLSMFGDLQVATVVAVVAAMLRQPKNRQPASPVGGTDSVPGIMQPSSTVQATA